MAEQDDKGLQGASPHAVTSTGRITLKKHEGEAIRRAAGMTAKQVAGKAPCDIVLTQDPDGCLLAFVPKAWKAFSAPILELSPMDPDAADLRRMYIGPAEDVTIDKQDRLKLSKNLRSWAGLSEEGAQVLLVDTGVRHELWEESAYRAYLTERGDDFKDLSRRLWGTTPKSGDAER